MAPANQPVKERIIDDIETTLAAIAEGADYFTDIKQVHRMDVGGPQMSAFPCIVITPGRTGYDQATRAVGSIEGRMLVGITVVLRQAGDAIRIVEQAIHDIHKALYVDPQRSQLALNTTVTDDRVWYTDDDRDPFVGAEITVEVHYRAQRTDPTATKV